MTIMLSLISNIYIINIVYYFMGVFKPLQLLEKKYEISKDKYIHKGACGKIFQAEKNKYLKIPFDINSGKLMNNKIYQKIIFNEFNFQKLTNDLGIKFPEVFQMNAVYDKKTGLYYPGFSMEEKKGIPFSKLSKIVLEKANLLRKKEIEKAKDYGFIIRDIHDNNALWLPENEDISLLDVGTCYLDPKSYLN